MKGTIRRACTAGLTPFVTPSPARSRACTLHQSCSMQTFVVLMQTPSGFSQAPALILTFWLLHCWILCMSPKKQWGFCFFLFLFFFVVIAGSLFLQRLFKAFSSIFVEALISFWDLKSGEDFLCYFLKRQVLSELSKAQQDPGLCRYQHCQILSAITKEPSKDALKRDENLFWISRSPAWGFLSAPGVSSLIMMISLL